MSFCSDLTLRWSPSFDALKMRRLRLLTDFSTLRQSMAFQSVGVRPSAPFAKPPFRPAPNFHLGWLSVTVSFGRLTRIASAPFQVRHRPYPAGYGFPSPFSCRHSLLDPSLS